MRRFIYLDTETINSYLAQIYDGLISSEEHESQSSKTNGTQSEHNVAAEGSADLKVFGKGLEGKISYAYNHLKDTSNLDLIKDVQTKLLHDNAFDQLVKYLRVKDELKRSGNIGDFVEISDSFYILDLEYYKKLFNDKTIMDILKKSRKDKMAEELKTLQDKELQNEGANIQEIKKRYQETLKEQSKQSDESYSEISRIIDVLTTLIPYRRTLCISNNLVVLKEKYMRDDIEMASFKYGGKIKVLGYITNTIGNSADIYNLPVFAQARSALNNIMLTFVTDKEDLNIVHPIAIYYE